MNTSTIITNKRERSLSMTTHDADSTPTGTQGENTSRRASLTSLTFGNLDANVQLRMPEPLPSLRLDEPRPRMVDFPWPAPASQFGPYDRFRLNFPRE